MVSRGIKWCYDEVSELCLVQVHLAVYWRHSRAERSLIEEAKSKTNWHRFSPAEREQFNYDRRALARVVVYHLLEFLMI